MAAINPTLSVVTLNVNGLSTSIKREVSVLSNVQKPVQRVKENEKI